MTYEQRSLIIQEKVLHNLQIHTSGTPDIIENFTKTSWDQSDTKKCAQIRKLMHIYTINSCLENIDKSVYCRTETIIQNHLTEDQFEYRKNQRHKKVIVALKIINHRTKDDERKTNIYCGPYKGI